MSMVSGMNAAATPWAAPALRIASAVAYPFLAHAASVRDSGALAACALGTIVLMVLADGLVRGRIAAWAALAASGVGLWWLAHSPLAHLPLLLVPVAFVGMVAWWFARTLRAGSVPLIGRIMAAMDGRPYLQVEPELQQYTRSLTRLWALVLGVMALCNLLLAAIAVPNGLLASAGIAASVTVTETQWSWIANWLNYGLVGGVFALEFAYRQRRFPGRYRNFADFARRMARLGPAFWRDLLR
jgi:uncharacterized membrane protein